MPVSLTNIQANTAPQPNPKAANNTLIDQILIARRETSTVFIKMSEMVSEHNKTLGQVQSLTESLQTLKGTYKNVQAILLNHKGAIAGLQKLLKESRDLLRKMMEFFVATQERYAGVAREPDGQRRWAKAKTLLLRPGVSMEQRVSLVGSLMKENIEDILQQEKRLQEQLNQARNEQNVSGKRDRNFIKTASAFKRS